MLEVLELAAFISFTKLPIRRRDVVASDGPTITGGDLKGEALTVEHRVTLPILPPIPWHWLPPCSRPFDRDCTDVSCSRNIGDQNQVEVRVSVQSESNPAFLYTRHPTITIIINTYSSTNQISHRVLVWN